MTVIVARRDDNFSRMLRDSGIEVINLELVGTEVIEDLGEFENLISRIAEYEGVFFTSPVAAREFVDRVTPSSVMPAIYALGARAASMLEHAGFAVKKVEHANTAEEMLAGFDESEFVGRRLLFVRGQRSMRTIPERLGPIADVDEVAVYRTVEIEPTEEAANDVRRRLLNGEIETICLFSPSAVEAFEKRFGTAASVAAIGETTAARARELGFEVELIASRATNDVFAQELIKRFKSV